MLNWLKSLFGRQSAKPGESHGRVRATYDAASIHDENAKHWRYVDALSARRANSLAVRKVIRERARYEVDNNSYAEGIIDTLANNLVGSGRRLSVSLGDEIVNQVVVDRWEEWSNAVALSDKLRTMCRAKKVDGEGFGLLISNPNINSPVQLDIHLLECDQVTTPFLDMRDPLSVDGIQFDGYGNVESYRVLRHHPGDWYGGPFDARPVSPRSMLHWFKKRRPGQVRGVSEITPSLGLFAQLRRFTLATLTAAETAAMFAAVLESDATMGPPAKADDVDDTFDALEIERGVMPQLPPGMRMNQFESKHPSTTYEMFEWCLIRQICRCLHIPLTIALGDSSKSNFSSARLDHLVYWAAVAVEREDCEREVLEPVFREWYAEARLIPDFLPRGLPARIPHSWNWSARPVIDPKTEAEANEINLRSGAATQADIAGGEGRDWRARIRQRVQEEMFEDELRAEMGARPRRDANAA